MAKSRLKVGDQVVVICGDDAGKSGKLLRFERSKQRVVVEGVNYVWRHMRKTQRHPQGGRLQKEASIHISNVIKSK